MFHEERPASCWPFSFLEPSAVRLLRLSSDERIAVLSEQYQCNDEQRTLDPEAVSGRVDAVADAEPYEESRNADGDERQGCRPFDDRHAAACGQDRKLHNLADHEADIERLH